MLQVLHTPVDTLQSAYAVNITAFIQPNPANTLASVSVFYRVDSGSFTEVAMTASGSNNYSAVIPAEPDGSFVEYYIRAEDSSGRVSAHPQYAPGTWFNHYTVSAAGISSGGVSPVKTVMLGTNPFSSSLVFSGEQGTSFSVYDGTGRMVYNSVAGEDGLMQWTPDASTACGVYFAKFVLGSSVSTSRAVLLR